MIKDKTIRSQKKNGKIRWAVCTDGSDKSIQAFYMIVKLIDKSKDEVVAITVQSRNINISEVEQKMNNHFA